MVRMVDVGQLQAHRAMIAKIFKSIESATPWNLDKVKIQINYTAEIMLAPYQDQMADVDLLTVPSAKIVLPRLLNLYLINK